MVSRIGSAVLDVEAERVSEHLCPGGEREVRYRLYVPEDAELALASLREQAANPSAALVFACLAGDPFFAEDLLYEDLGRRGDRRVIELDALWVGTPGSHFWAYELQLGVAENAWGI